MLGRTVGNWYSEVEQRSNVLPCGEGVALIFCPQLRGRSASAMYQLRLVCAIFAVAKFIEASRWNRTNGGRLATPHSMARGASRP